MAKQTKQEEEKPTRADARVDVLKRLSHTLDAMPLSSISKHLILAHFQQTNNRMNDTQEACRGKINIKKWEAKWKEMNYNDLFKEYMEVEKHFKNLNIFSDEFYTTLNMRWNDLLNTYSPHHAHYFKD